MCLDMAKRGELTEGSIGRGREYIRALVYSEDFY